MLEEIPEGQDNLTSEERKHFRLLRETVGVDGIMFEKPILQDQDLIALPTEGYAVAFFPKISQIGPATLAWYTVMETFSKTSEAAIIKFMDKIAINEKWENYQNAGHKVRKVQIIDLGDPT